MEDLYRKQRIEKIDVLKQLGFAAYPNGIVPTHRVFDIRSRYEALTAGALQALGETFSICGRVMAIRLFGKAGFLQIQDASGQLQVFVQKQAVSDREFELFKKLDAGDFLWAQGTLFRTQTDEFSLKASKIVLVTKCLQTLPEKWHGLTDVEIRYRQRYVDLMVNPEVRHTFLKRSEIVQWLRQFLVERGFLEVETPMMQPISGGAKAKPFVTHHNALRRDLYLRIAPELYLKRLVVGGIERVFELNRSFRNEGISTQHNPEFTMLEFYQAYATYEDLMCLTEEMLSRLAREVMGSDSLPYGEQMISWKAPFARYTLLEALQKFAGYSAIQCMDLNFLKNECERCKLKVDAKAGATVGVYQTLLFEEKVEQALLGPTFITQFPIDVSPLSRRNDHNPDCADRFELFIFGREIANAFSELNDPLDQAERFRKQAEAKAAGDEEAMAYDADFIRALEYGMPPTAGEGIGIDRLVMLLTNNPSIRDVILFPQLRDEA